MTLYKKIFILFITGIFLGTFFYNTALANVYQFNLGTVQTTAPTPTNKSYFLFNGPLYSASHDGHIYMYAQSPFTGTRTISIYATACDDVALTINCGGTLDATNSFNFAVANTPYVLDLTFDLSAYDGQYVLFGFANSGGFIKWLGLDNSFTDPNFTCYSNCYGITAPYFVAYGVDIDLTNVPSDITSIISPVFGTGYDNTQIEFSGTYINTLTYDNVVVYLQNLSIGYGEEIYIPIPSENTIYGTFSTIKNLEPGDYTATFALYDSSSGLTTTFGNSTDFQITSLSPIVDPESTCSLTNIASCLYDFVNWLLIPSDTVLDLYKGLPDLLSEQFPFAYFFDIKDAIIDGTSATANANPSFTLDFTDTQLPFEVELFSEDTMQELIPTTVSDAFKAIITFSLWLSVIYYVYRKILSIKI